MKKQFSLLLLPVILLFAACKKESVDSGAASGNLVSPPSNVSSTILVSSGGISSDILNEPFNGNFKIEVPDINNIFENQPVKLVSKSLDVVSYVWKINDLKLTDARPVLTFPWHGLYHITLIVTDKDGNTSTSSQDITILCNFMHNKPL